MSLTRRPTVNRAAMQGQSSRQQLKSVHAIFGMITLVVGILGLVCPFITLLNAGW
jgi:hypothetical protein